MTIEQNMIRPLAPEDVTVGDIVVVTEAFAQFPPDCGAAPGAQDIEPVRMRFMPHNAGWPYEVAAVCVPFVVAADCVRREVETFDMRRMRLARVPASYAQAAMDREEARRKAEAERESSSEPDADARSEARDES